MSLSSRIWRHPLKTWVTVSLLASFVVAGDSFSLPIPPALQQSQAFANSRGGCGFILGGRGKIQCLAAGSNSDDGDKSAVEEDKIEMKTWNPLRLAVLKLGFTEPMWSSPLNYNKEDGAYSCAYCGNILFESTSKYDSGSGWPSFWRSYRDGSIGYKREIDGRLECLCGKCKSHLGHVFPDGPKFDDVEADVFGSMPPSDPKTDTRLPRFCMNGASLRFEPRN